MKKIPKEKETIIVVSFLYLILSILTKRTLRFLIKRKKKTIIPSIFVNLWILQKIEKEIDKQEEKKIRIETEEED